MIEKKKIKEQINEFSLSYNQEDNLFRKICIENLGFVLAYDLYGAGDKSIPISMFYDGVNHRICRS